MCLALILAQGGTGLSGKVVVMPHPLYQVALVVAALLFVVAIVKGGMDMGRPKDPDAPKPTPITWMSRLVPFFVSLFFSASIILVLAKVVSPMTLRGYSAFAILLVALQATVAVMAWMNPDGKRIMRIIQTALLVASLIALPLFLL